MRLDSLAARLSKESEMVGLAVAVVEKGEITHLKGYGTVYPGGPAVDEDTVFRWASLSKGVAGTVAGIVAADGQLSIDKPVSNYKSSLKLAGQGEKKITVAQILSHQTGIVPNAYDNLLEAGQDPKQIRGKLSGLKPICTPGECHTYQNVAFDAVAEVLEAATTTPYPDLVKSRLFEPLGMTSASLSRAELTANDNYARPFRWSSRTDTVFPDKLNDAYYNVPAAGGVNSSIKDLALYLKAQMGGAPNVLPREILETIHTPRIETLRERNSMRRRYGRINRADYGLGWRIYDYEGRRVIGHRGAVRGYRALILFDPELETGIAALWNSSSRRPVGLQFEFMDMLYGLQSEDWAKLGG